MERQKAPLLRWFSRSGAVCRLPARRVRQIGKPRSNLFDTGGQPKESQTRRTPGPSPTRHRSCRKVSRSPEGRDATTHLAPPEEREQTRGPTSPTFGRVVGASRRICLGQCLGQCLSAPPHPRCLWTAVSEAAWLADLPPSCLGLEVKETAVMVNPEGASAVLRRTADDGFGVALDDFGTGYSSLAHLRRLPVSRVKIDRSFVVDAAEGAALDRTICASVASRRARTSASRRSQRASRRRRSTTCCRNWDALPGRDISGTSR